jgi:hypothetical protein
VDKMQSITTDDHNRIIDLEPMSESEILEDMNAWEKERNSLNEKALQNRNEYDALKHTLMEYKDKFIAFSDGKVQKSSISLVEASAHNTFDPTALIIRVGHEKDTINISNDILMIGDQKDE